MASNKKHVFTPLEKKAFLDILKRYACVIENKNTDGASLRAKKEAWDNVEREFNASPHAISQASSTQLRRLWLNLKQRQRDALTKERQHRMATGGGPSTSDVNVDPDVAEIAPALIVAIGEAIDSDTFLASSEITGTTIETQDSDSELYPYPSCSQRFEFVPVPRPPAGIILTSSPPPSLPQCSRRPPAAPASSSPPPLPPASTSPPTPPPASTSPPPPPPSIPVNASLQRYKNSILAKEYQDRKRRADEMHAEEINILLLKKREAKAKADLAELVVLQQELEKNLLKEKCREAKAKADLVEMVLQQKRLGDE